MRRVKVSLCNLLVLSLKNCKLRRLDTSIAELVCLKELYLENNRIVQLPDTVRNLQMLQVGVPGMDVIMVNLSALIDSESMVELIRHKCRNSGREVSILWAIVLTVSKAFNESIERALDTLNDRPEAIFLLQLSILSMFSGVSARASIFFIASMSKGATPCLASKTTINLGEGGKHHVSLHKTLEKGNSVEVRSRVAKRVGQTSVLYINTIVHRQTYCLFGERTLVARAWGNGFRYST